MNRVTDKRSEKSLRMVATFLVLIFVFLVSFPATVGALADETPIMVGATTCRLNLREGPTTESNRLDTFDTNTILFIYEDLDEWYRVDGGYVFKQYVKICNNDIFDAVTSSNFYYIIEFYADNMVNLKNHYLGKLSGKCKASGVTKNGTINIKGYIPCYDVIGSFAYFASGRNIYKVNVSYFSEIKHVGSDYEILDVYRTTFFDSSKNRKHNINLVSSIIDGTIVKSGKTFSYNKTTGPRDEAHGYKEATVIMNKEYTQDFGGGVCQVSSTIYAAIMRDYNFRITSRKAHSLEVSYLPIGMDATVSYGGTDFKFINKYPFDIKIKIYSDDGVCIVAIVRA